MWRRRVAGFSVLIRNTAIAPPTLATSPRNRHAQVSQWSRGRKIGAGAKSWCLFTFSHSCHELSLVQLAVSLPFKWPTKGRASRLAAGWDADEEPQHQLEQRLRRVDQRLVSHLKVWKPKVSEWLRSLRDVYRVHRASLPWASGWHRLPGNNNLRVIFFDCNNGPMYHWPISPQRLLGTIDRVENSDGADEEMLAYDRPIARYL